MKAGKSNSGTLVRDLALSAVVILVGAIALTRILYDWNRGKVLKDAEDFVATVAAREASMLERCAEAHLAALQAVAATPLRAGEEPGDWLVRVWTDAGVARTYAGLALMDRELQIVTSVPPGSVGPGLANAVLSKLGDSPAVVFAGQDSEGEPVGVAAVRLRKDGRVLVGRFAESSWQVFAGNSRGLTGDLVVSKEEALNGWLKDRGRVYATVWSEPLGVGLAVGMPDEVALRQVRRARTLTLIVFGFLAGLMILCGYYFARRLIVPLKDGAEVASRLAEGDLSVHFKIQGPREVREMLESLERIKAKFADVLGRMRWSATNVADASVKLSSGSQEMSQSSQELASIVQQGRATFEEMETGIRMTADHAARSKEEIGSAAKVVEQGADMGQRAANVMKAFVDQAQKMTEIIQVTSELSFQTNLLALNAAVEAARAGEHGRGFAVVANEIRALAQRSAESSKRVKEMIETTLQEIRRGMQETQQLGALMSEAKSSMAKIAEVMDEISLATKEQAAAVDQVSKSLGQVDEVAQRNAAFVEELASSSEQLAAAARDLEQMVSYFKLGGTEVSGFARSSAEASPAHEQVQVVDSYVAPV
ncbi:MAG: methyl-accepting chemotaxis protein, partial [Calditrichaeota bacterium]|nr:methyl-accepting chemotaxis protein [Calditrichota bacterium]